MNQRDSITFIVTKSCQLRCKYCYLVGKNPNEKMSLEMAKRVVDYVLENETIFHGDSVVLDFIGGEPLLEIDLISKTCDYFVKRIEENGHRWGANYSFHITTNGLLYSTRAVQEFVLKYKDVVEISISIDGTKEKNDTNRVFEDGSGSYSKIIDNIHLWKKQFGKIGTKMVISHEDLKYVFESAKHLIELGITDLDMNAVVEDVWKPGDDKIFEDELIKLADYVVDNELYDKLNLFIFEEGIGHPLDMNDLPNPCGDKQFAVDASGDFYTCLRFAKFSLRTKTARTIGNVKNGINTNLLRPFLLANDEYISNLDCKDCEIATGCRWCPAENYDASLSSTIFERATAICKMHRARVRAKNYYWNRIYKQS